MPLLTRRQFAIAAAFGLPVFAGASGLRARPTGVRAAGDNATRSGVVLATGGQDPTVAVNPITGTMYVAWFQTIANGIAPLPVTGGVLLARSDDGGGTFAPPVVVSGTDSDVISYPGSPPQVVLGPQREVYVAYGRFAFDEGGGFGNELVRLARSTDDGQAFAPAVDVFGGEDAATSGVFHDILVAPDGTVYVARLAYDPGATGGSAAPLTSVRVARSDDGGATFSPSVRADDDACDCCRVALSIGPDGGLALAWRDRQPHADGGDPVRNMVVAGSADRGATWEAPTLIHDDGWRVAQCPESGPAIVTDAEGRLRAAWFTGKADGAGVYYAATPDAGAGFATPTTLLTDAYFPHANVRLALDNAGTTWVAWDDHRTEPGRVQLVGIGADGVPTPAADLAGRTPDVAIGPEGPVLAWLGEDGIRVVAVAKDGGDA